MGVFGLGSLLGIDQVLRTWAGRKLFGRKKPLASDTTLSRSLEGFDLSGLHWLLQTIYQLARRVGPSRCLLRDGRWRIGVVDGSSFKRFSASCFAEIGAVCLMGGLERILKRGKELPSSERLLHKLLKQFSRRWVDLLFLDGLYVAQKFLRLCWKECGIDFLIKIQEEGLDILQDAMRMFQSEVFSEDIERREGTDAGRMISYQVSALGGFFLEGVDSPLKVAWVREEHLRTGEKSQFWVITSLQELTAWEMRELGHWRWDIENNGFKVLNSLVHTKHLYSHQSQAAEAVLAILFLAGTLLQVFFATLSQEELEALVGKAKITQKFLQFLLLASLIVLASADP